MADCVRFVHRGQVVTLSDVPPTRTVLDYLREDRGRRGTKEGCNEGDCGACTIVLGTRVGVLGVTEAESIQYRAVNACILFVTALDGKELVTVEDLAGPDGTLHPIQQAMVDHHGSQCGFCTPGFVMSLFALYHTEADPDRPRIDAALAGNLCRCTGYRPIVDAARAMGRAPDTYTAQMTETLALLRSIERHETLSHPGGTAFAPATSDQLADLLLAHPDATIVAGGTDVGLWVTKQMRDLGTIIHIGGISDLAGITHTNGQINIGATATVTDAAEILSRLYPDLGELFRRYGSEQVRNSATLGGNIANGSPIGDSMPALIALGSTLVLRRGGVTREMPLQDFFLSYRKTALQPGEFVAAIRVPEPSADRLFACYKISKRFDQDISAVMAGFGLTLKDGIVTEARLAFGGMAGTPKRASRAEAALIGRPFDATSAKEAAAALAQDFQPLTDMRASADYRLVTAGNLILKWQMEQALPATATRVPAFARAIGGAA
ncbi:xanthine dehydrogenase small subunit [Niveispirillum lacus]|uniref:Xanthine dehydrogenase small subunit n=1 Tax=Niveispirillum lacus TaxID=1981099 RepID=A0A255YQR1_9PROT|nr:xanthine dehydrogenase small subunit [Niveispirillum lacus]OYQ31521.1 xanthine dehydrogenase small subunit [Niveispirillum lacus]